MSAPEPVRVVDTRIETVERFQPNQANNNGNTHGGEVLRLMDELAAVAAMAADAGANWIILFPQYSLGPGQSAIKRHIERVAGGVELPVMLQYAPGRPGSPSP